MANSIRLKQLESRISVIENHLLPPVKIMGNYTKKESDLIRSYVVLVHAEIEAYFEDIASNKAKKAIDKWVLSRKKSNCLLSIMTFCSGDINWKDENRDKNNLEKRIKRTVNHYINGLDNNHGIKAKNIQKILLPLGIEEDEIDSAWLSTMDSFGSTRGSIAHSTYRVQEQIDLQTEKTRINNLILPEIRLLDEKVRALI